jgi:hypothetical protein
MSAVLTDPHAFSAELVAGIVGLSMVVGVVDLVRKPGWAWRKADEFKIPYLVLVALLPLIGLGLYLYGPRKKVCQVAKAGKAASLPFERFGDVNVERTGSISPTYGVMADPAPLTSFASHFGVSPDGPPPDASGTVRVPLSLPRSYRPRQRQSIDEAPLRPSGSVPPGWKADPTGRHQVRYWSGSDWTEDVADEGVRTRDTVRA